jgi:hypothetical protein
MLHFALVNNLLAALGAAPRVGRPNLPVQGRHYPPGVQFALMPFGEPALRHFLYLERPEGITLADAEGFEALREAEPVMDPEDIVPRPQDFSTVGELYRSIEEGFERLVERYGEEWVFIGDASSQATPETFQWPELVAVSDLKTAKQAIDVIVEQGEGTTTSPIDPESNTPAHYYRFEEIVKGRRLISNPNPPPNPKPDDLYVFGGAPVAFDRDGVWDVVADPDPTKFSEPAKQACDNFNYTYTALLKTLHATFNGQPELLGQAIGAMWSLQEQAMTVMEIPAGDGSGKNAGPSFQYQPVNPALA